MRSVVKEVVDGIERYKSADRKIFVVCTRDHKQWNTIQTPSMQIGFKFKEMRCARLGSRIYDPRFVDKSRLNQKWLGVEIM